MNSAPGTKGNPVLVRLVSDTDGSLKVGRLVMMVAATAAMAWLSVAIQRGMSGPDVGRTIKMKGAMLVKDYAYGRADYWASMGAKAATAYQKASIL